MLRRDLPNVRLEGIEPGRDIKGLDSPIRITILANQQAIATVHWVIRCICVLIPYLLKGLLARVAPFVFLSTVDARSLSRINRSVKAVLPRCFIGNNEV